MKQVWFVSRQQYWGVEPEDGQYTVEIAYGGRDYANPDMLVPQYPGEGEEYTDPRKAVEAARRISEFWSHGFPYIAEFIGVAYGCTGGDTIPFEHEPIEDIVAWAEKRVYSLVLVRLLV